MIKNSYKILVNNPEGEKLFQILRHKWKDNFKPNVVWWKSEFEVGDLMLSQWYCWGFSLLVGDGVQGTTVLQLCSNHTLSGIASCPRSTESSLQSGFIYWG